MSSKVILPDKEMVEEWVSLLHKSKYAKFLNKHLPRMDNHWISEVISVCELVSFPYYPDDLDHKAALIFYKNIKNHRLTDGNKRTAVIILYLIYLINNKTIKIKPMALRSLARKVAADKIIETPKIKESEAVVAITRVILSQIVSPI